MYCDVVKGIQDAYMRRAMPPVSKAGNTMPVHPVQYIKTQTSNP
jgi:hypothetical protein